MKIITKCFCIVFMAMFVSCTSYKNIPYFKDLDKEEPSINQIQNFSPLTIQPGDILGINVSSLNPEASAIFNYNLNRINGSNFDTSPNNPVVGYLVDQNGEIEIPLIGKMQVGGYTTNHIKNELKNKVQNYLSEPIVNIRLINFKVSVIGDVLKPGVFTVQNEQITMSEALSLAGDLQITAERQILLIRELEGKREIIPIDLNSKDFFNTPYYYMKNNDVIYVQPSRTKLTAVNRGYQNATVVLSAMSVLAIIFSTLYR